MSSGCVDHVTANTPEEDSEFVAAKSDCTPSYEVV